MGFASYLFLIKPGIIALTNLGKGIVKHKKDDGKIDAGEAGELFLDFVNDIFPFVEPLIRKDDDK